MANLNKVMLIGNLTRDPELKYTPSQMPIVEFGIATNRHWTKDGQKQEEVTFVDCVSFGKQAETLNKYMKKGRPLFVEGRLKLDSWTAQDGSKRSRMRVVIETFQFLGSGQGGQGGQGGGYSQGNQQSGQQQQGGGYNQQQNNAPAANMDAPPAPMDDDIPF